MNDYRCSDCKKASSHVCEHHIEITRLCNLGTIKFAGRASGAAKLFSLVEVVSRTMDEGNAHTRSGSRQ